MFFRKQTFWDSCPYFSWLHPFSSFLKEIPTLRSLYLAAATISFDLYKIASKLTSILTILVNMYCNCKWPHFSSIDSILVSITIILTSIVTILVSIEQVNTPYAFLSNVLKIGNLLSLPLSFYFPKKNFKKSNSWNCKSNSFKTVT